MSFLAGRLAATEGSYFLQESKHAAGRLAEKLPRQSSSTSAAARLGPAADVLPEILRHSIPLKVAAAADSSLSKSKWLVDGSAARSSAASAVLNPFRDYVSLPQATFGPRRWQLPEEHLAFPASTANDLRRDKYPSASPEKLKAVASGLSRIGAAFAIATAIVFGGAAAAVLQLQIHNAEEIKTKGKGLIQPTADALRESMVPLRTWAESMSRKWRLGRNEEVKENTVLKELSKVLKN